MGSTESVNTNKDWRKGSVLENGVFTNPFCKDPIPPAMSYIASYAWQRNVPSAPSCEECSKILPVHKIDWKQFIHNSKRLVFSWIGHATCYVAMSGGLRVITDPIFSERASPVSIAGAARITPPASEGDEVLLPHLVLISHDHYDHLDVDSIRKFEERAHELKEESKPVYCFGLGFKEWFMSTFPSIEESRLVELDWWEARDFNIETGDKCRVEFVPAQHWSSRTAFDLKKRLWGGFVVTDKEQKKFYYTGDTGFNEELFQEIGDRYGPIDIAAIAIGSYGPQWFMGPQHVDPVEAHRLHRLVKSSFSVGVHWGTFLLSDEPIMEPKAMLAAEVLKHPDANPFVTLEHGTVHVIEKEI